MIEPASSLERSIFDVWTDLSPAAAFAQGVDACAGRVFVPSDANLRRALRRIDSLKARTRDPTARKVLASLKARLQLTEPDALPYEILEAFFTHLMKEGFVPGHLISLAVEGRSALLAGLPPAERTWPPGMRALTLIACHGLATVLDTVDSEMPDESVRKAVNGLRDALGRYAKNFELPGFRPDAPFDELYESYRRRGSDLGRSRQYRRALRDLWDYRETSAEVEAAGLRMLRRELPRFRDLVRRKARELQCPPSAEAIQEALRDVRGLDPKSILPFLHAVRRPTALIADKYVVAINPRYDARIVATPPYLATMTPSGAAYEFDTFTDRSYEIFLATTDEHAAGRPPPAELLNLLIHEEYGHCVHGSNSAHAFMGRPGLLDLINSSFECVSEGIAFQREIEFLPVLQAIAEGKAVGAEEEAFVRALEPWGGVRAVVRDYAFLTYLWRIVRFLRVVGDARINSGKQDLVEFIEWAHARTGLKRETIYGNLFPGHQVLGPGYATTYAIIGERIREIQEKALKRGADLRSFNGFASSIGWPPRSVFEAKLEAWVRNLR